MTIQLAKEEFAELATDLLGFGHAVSFPAAGSSMSPFIRNGDILTAVSVPFDSLVTGDIILYRRCDGIPVAHRIIDRSMINSESAVLVRGDARLCASERVPLSRIDGKIIGIHRSGRNIPIGPTARTMALVWINLQPLSNLSLQVVRFILRSFRLLSRTLQELRVIRQHAANIISRKKVQVKRRDTCNHIPA